MLAAGVASVAGCARPADGPGGSGGTAGPAPTRSPAGSPTAGGARGAPPRPRLPPAAPWTPGGAEVEPSAKVAAARLLEAVGTRQNRSSSLQQRLADAGAPAGLAVTAARLVPPHVPASTRVVYPQYGGLTADAASVMTVAEQSWRRPGGGIARRTVTVDVRLSRGGDGWQVTDLLVAEEPAPATPPPGPEVAALLDHRRVDLPDAARAELAAGLVDPLVVDALLRLAPTYSMAVSVFGAGHPPNVFGTSSTSNHTRGRAVDIWAIDGQPVVDLAIDDDLLRRFLLDVGATGSDEVGGPSVPAGAGAGYFANALHRDHVHLGFDA